MGYFLTYFTVSVCFQTNISYISDGHISKSKRCYNAKPSTCFFYEDEDIHRFSHLHWCNFKVKVDMFKVNNREKKSAAEVVLMTLFGNFKRIFPCQGNKYDELFWRCSDVVFFLTSNKFSPWRKSLLTTQLHEKKLTVFLQANWSQPRYEFLERRN